MSTTNTNLTHAFASKTAATGERSVAAKTGQTAASGGSKADFDEAAYRHHLDGLDLTDAQASELMRVVWSIMRMFVEMNLPADSCGQIVQGLIEQAREESDALD